jgi:predicted HicB family RNase H-like nuclease
MKNGKVSVKLDQEIHKAWRIKAANEELSMMNTLRKLFGLKLKDKRLRKIEN